MLTLFEKFEQKNLKKNGAKSYDVTVTLALSDGEKKDIEYTFYALTDNDALELGERIRYREQEKIKEGDSVLDRLGLNFRETLSNKWGLIAPWKDPIYKRSIMRGSKLPILRALSSFRSIESFAKSSYPIITKSDLTRSDINTHIFKCIKDYIFCAFIILFSVSSLAISWINGTSNFVYWLCCALFVLVFCVTQLMKSINKHKVLLLWKGDLDGR